MKYLRRDTEKVRKIQGWSWVSPPMWRNKSHTNITSRVAPAPWTSWHTDTHYHNLRRCRRRCRRLIRLRRVFVPPIVRHRPLQADCASESRPPLRVCARRFVRNLFSLSECFLFHSLQLSLFSSSRMKSPWVIPPAAPAIYQRWAKHRQMEWERRMNEWMMRGLHPPRRKRRARTWKTGGRRRGEGRRLTGQTVVQRNESGWWLTRLSLSHRVGPISRGSLINGRRTDASSKPAAPSQTGPTPSPSLVGPSVSSLCSPPLPWATSASNATSGLHDCSPESLKG